MIRLFFITLFLILFFVAGLVLFLILWIVGKFNLHTRHIMSLRIVQWTFKVILFLAGAKLDIKGYENIPEDQPVLYVANHQGFFDIVSCYSIVPGLTGFVAKKSMEKVPFLNIWMILVNCLFMDRKNLRAGVKTIFKGVEYLKNGISIFIFPEGTRSADGTLAEFKEGSLKMATKACVPIVPIAFGGTSAIFEDHLPAIKKGTISIDIGEPIYCDQLTKEEQKHLGSRTRQIIQDMLDQKTIK